MLPATAVNVVWPIPFRCMVPRYAINHIAHTLESHNYAPKRIVLQAKAAHPAALLLNDRFASHGKNLFCNWKL